MDFDSLKWIKDNLFKSNGHLISQRLNDAFIPSKILSQLNEIEGFDLRDKCLIATRGAMYCAGCGKILLPYPRFYGNPTKKTYCSKECMPCKDKGECVVCGKPFEKKNSNIMTCSRACGVIYRERRHLEKYGVKNPKHRKEVNEKTKATLLERYGVDGVMRVKEFKQKAKDTMHRNWEGGHNMRDPAFLEKHKDIHTNNAKVARQNYFDKTGFRTPFDNPETFKKAKETFMKHYGVSSPFESPDIHAKCLNSYLKNRPKNQKDAKTIEWWNENYISGVTSLTYLAKKFGVHQPQLSTWAKNLGIEVVNPKVSSRHKILLDFLDENKITYKVNDRKTIEPLEIDILLPDYNLAIEVNGSYWHSESQKGETYHFDKSLACHDKGIRLIHLWEWTDLDKFKGVIKSVVSPLKYDARKCVIMEIDSSVAKTFCDENHLQNGLYSKYNFGLYIEGEIVMVATLSKPRFNKKFDYELIRMCSKMGTRVRGGASKLLSHVKKTLGGSIITYSSIDMGFNKVYENCGFEKVGTSSPGYWWCNDTYIFTRHQTQKHKLSDILGESFDPGLSESENMKAAGFFKVYDCGNEVFVLQ